MNNSDYKELFIKLFHLINLLKRSKETYRQMFMPEEDFFQNHAQGRMLTTIVENPGLNNKEISELLEIRTPSSNQLINKLINASFVIKETDKKDKRIVRFFATKKGLEKAKSAYQLFDMFLEHLFEDMPKQELIAFNKFIDKLSNKINTDLEKGKD